MSCIVFASVQPMRQCSGRLCRIHVPSPFVQPALPVVMYKGLRVCYRYNCKVGFSSVRSSRRRVKYDYTRGAESVLNVRKSDIASRRIP